jgi:Tfp pilus assembly protein PilF
MFTKKILMFIAGVMFCFNAAQAGQLLGGEADKYLRDGIDKQKAGKYAEAESYYKKALMLDPSSPQRKALVANNRGVILAEAGDITGAEEQFKYALALDPELKSATNNLEFIAETRRTELESLKHWIKVLNIDIEKAKPKGYMIGESAE